MESAVQAYREFDAESAKAFAAAAQRYTEHLLSHLLREDAILFRIADEVLDEEDKDKLAYQFRQAQLSLGPAAYEQLEQRATTLEAEWAI
jgi:hemerythrin-like domain-containing protein